MKDFVSNKFQGFSLVISPNIEDKYFENVHLFAQRQHIASLLFSLDEILVEPLLQVPPLLSEQDANAFLADVVSKNIPYLPDWPELGAHYGSHTLTLAQAIQKGTSIALIGKPGSGKTVALAHLASSIARKDKTIDGLGLRFPIFVHVGGLITSNQQSGDPLNVLVDALSAYMPGNIQKKVPDLVKRAFRDDRAVLIIDGLDELPPIYIDKSVAYLRSLRKGYPNIQIVAAASDEYYGGLARLGLRPLGMSTWNDTHRSGLVERWIKLWNLVASTSAAPSKDNIDPLLIKNWLLTDNLGSTKLEFTLKIWSGFTGDDLGLSPHHHIESYIRRMTAELPNSRHALEMFALHSLLTQKVGLSRKEHQLWDGHGSTPNHITENETQEELLFEETEIRKDIADFNKILLPLLENGFLVERTGRRLFFAHPVVGWYLAASKLAKLRREHHLLDQPRWAGRTQIHQFLAALGDVHELVDNQLNVQDDPLLIDLLNAARWLRYAPDNTSWRPRVLRTLATQLKDPGNPYGLATRILTALAVSNDQGVNALFRQLLDSGDEHLRRLAILGCGLLRDRLSITRIAKFLDESNTETAGAACIALVAIGTLPSLEAVAAALLYGQEEIRRYAAEALANHPEEGHPTLEDGSKVEDLVTRHAVVFGLKRVNLPWAKELLEKLSLEDSQWVVRNAAAQVIEELPQPDPHIPEPVFLLTETPWLIAFAGKLGIGVSPGKPAMKLLLRALSEGEEYERQAALEALIIRGDRVAIPLIARLFHGSHGRLRESAYNTLWHLEAAGIPSAISQVSDTVEA